MSNLKFPNAISLVMNLLESELENKEKDLEGVYIRMPATVKLNDIFEKYLISKRSYDSSSKNKIVDVLLFKSDDKTYGIEIYFKDKWRDVSRFARSHYLNIPETTIKTVIDELLQLKGVVHKMHTQEFYNPSNSYEDPWKIVEVAFK